MNNSLLEVKETFWTKICNFFRNLFRRKNKEVNLEHKNIEINNEKNNNEIKYNKKEFFELYNKIKKGQISVLNIDISVLEKINDVLEEECKLREKKLENSKKELNFLMNN